MEAIIDDFRPRFPVNNGSADVRSSQRPWRLVRRALKWMLLATITAFMFTLVPAFVDGIQRGLASAKGLTQNPPADFSAFLVYGAVGLQAVLLWGALRGARLAAGGNLGSGLGNRPVARRRLVALLAVLCLTWDIVAIGTVAWIVMHGGPGPGGPSQFAKMPHSVAAGALHIAFLGLIAPVAEELFFRGWLWTALRPSWSPAWTLSCTSGLWLAMHLSDGLWRPIMLIPAGIFLGLARHYGNSVRASLALHLLNNGLVVLIQLIPLLLAG